MKDYLEIYVLGFGLKPCGWPCFLLYHPTSIILRLADTPCETAGKEIPSKIALLPFLCLSSNQLNGQLERWSCKKDQNPPQWIVCPCFALGVWQDVEQHQITLIGVGIMVRVSGSGSSGPEFKSCYAIKLIPCGVDSAGHPSEVGKNEYQPAGILCRSGDPSRIVPNSPRNCLGSTDALHRVWSQWMDGPNNWQLHPICDLVGLIR